MAIDNSGIREKYKSLIRQLPSELIIETLIRAFFREVNHQYYPLDEGIFRDHLKDWNGLSFSRLKNAPLELSGDMKFFPALLFQCLALALQFLPLEYDPNLESLKYAVGMSFDDVASDYSQSGTSIMALLGKQHTTLLGFLLESHCFWSLVTGISSHTNLSTTTWNPDSHKAETTRLGRGGLECQSLYIICHWSYIWGCNMGMEFWPNDRNLDHLCRDPNRLHCPTILRYLYNSRSSVVPNRVYCI